MKLDTSVDSVSVQNRYNDKDSARCIISEENGGSILSVYIYPYVGYLAEWKNSNDKWRTVLVVPKYHTKAWLDDLVQEQAEKENYLVGIINLDDIELPTYVVPEDYRKFMGGNGPRPDWYDV